MIEIKEYWFRMECLLYKLHIGTVDPHGHMRLMRLSNFANAVIYHTGISNPFYINGRAVELHEF